MGDGSTGADEAKARFIEALDIARRQQTRSYELRAAMSLYRLCGDEDSRRRLAEAYEWFTEGFDTLDLKDARAMLEGEPR